MMRIADLILTLPLIAVAAMLGAQLRRHLVADRLRDRRLYWAYVSRVARGVVLSLREKEFVEAPRRWAPPTGGSSCGT
jgi:peptide/nickel transport system permease protein